MLHVCQLDPRRPHLILQFLLLVRALRCESHELIELCKRLLDLHSCLQLMALLLSQTINGHHSVGPIASRIPSLVSLIDVAEGQGSSRFRRAG
ncbi:hypothetical protein CERSUDRAFT_84499 [Gelatoporia subvermispora B]|uniref:Uncharacterized protein n=1 Tax=Ceriporiopsis subvermispora (strain B) TaxID=914234 RepID=M2QW91_CERS8|nr:hypothetical protein CERSUDRAFT_84499 [Gelatoporia subvermispora B]